MAEPMKVWRCECGSIGTFPGRCLNLSHGAHPDGGRELVEEVEVIPVERMAEWAGKLLSDEAAEAKAERDKLEARCEGLKERLLAEAQRLDDEAAESSENPTISAVKRIQAETIRKALEAADKETTDA